MDATNLIRTLVPRTVRNWLRSPRKTVAYVVDRVAYRFGYTPKVIVAPGWQVLCHPLSRSGFEGIYRDCQQRRELERFVAHSQPGMQLLDIGAHHGLFSLAALHCGGVRARVLAVEASSWAAQILRINLFLNRGMDRAIVVETAAGETDGELAVLTTGPTTADYVTAPQGDRRDVRRLPMRPIASIVHEHRFRPTHVKIAVEGFEEEVILGARPVLARYQPILFLELHGTIIRGRNKRPQSVLENLAACGYWKFEIDGCMVDRGEIERRDYNCRVVCSA